MDEEKIRQMAELLVQSKVSPIYKNIFDHYEKKLSPDVLVAVLLEMERMEEQQGHPGFETRSIKKGDEFFKFLNDRTRLDNKGR